LIISPAYSRCCELDPFKLFHDELVRGIALGADFLVVHPGARGEAKIELAIATIVNSVKEAVRRVQLGKLRILIENTAGMGSAVGSRLEEVAAIARGLSSLGVVPASTPRICSQPVTTSALRAASKPPFHKSNKPLASIMFTFGTSMIPRSRSAAKSTATKHRPRKNESRGLRANSAAPEIRHKPGHRHARPPIYSRDTIEEPGDDRRNVAKLWELAGEKGPPAETGFSMLTGGAQEKTRRASKEAVKTAKALAKHNLQKKKKG